ncbi:hypothetical protein O181_005142 [Austropuccinia psidii MF-1]|uniref:Uncharacterized protein n=1 Tax=Austropuccinia psidii MF-1 TaxID=1389203 RepID=A0A9Q3BHK5_9BASI|nr:hypothetical protein [Austropuccinia psidii MF-1]
MTFPAILGKVRFDGPGPSQWAQAMRAKLCFMAIFMVPWTPWVPSSLVIFGIGGSSNPHGPQTIGHAKDQKGPKRPLITIPSKSGQKWIFRPNFKDNGDKPPPWMMVKANQGEEEQLPSQ